jgi:hypothetical protein
MGPPCFLSAVLPGAGITWQDALVLPEQDVYLAWARMRPKFSPASRPWVMSLPGMMQARTLIVLSSTSIAPNHGQVRAPDHARATSQ